MNMNPYLFFDGQCEEAFKFYAECLGGKVVASMKYGDAGNCESLGPEARDRIMHTAIALGDRMLMASDCPPGQYQKPQGLSIAIDFDTPDEAERVFKALSEKGQISMPMNETFWAEKFGMATDRFGTPWMVGCNKKPVAV
jgi:PhnB protein